MQDERRPERWFLPLLIATTAVFKLVLAWCSPGFLTGDDVEIVETAAKFAVGLDYTPWAIRSLFHPLVFALPFVKAGAIAGLASARWLAFLATLPGVLASSVAIGLVHRLARDLGCGEGAARGAALLYAVHWLPLAYGSTAYPRPISTALLVGAFLLVWHSRGRTGLASAAGALAACAFAVRWSEGLFLAPLAAVAWWKDRRPSSLFALAGGFAAGTVLAVGVFDALTWGAPFASLAAFLRYAREVGLEGSHPWHWYGWSAFRWLGPAWPVLLVLGWPDRRSRLPLSVAAGMLALLSFSAFKELRYLQIVIPFLSIAAALGSERLRAGAGWRKGLAAIVLAGAVAWGLERTLALMNGKSRPAVEAALYLHSLAPPVSIVALEQQWAFGDRLILGNGVRIRGITPDRPLRPSSVEAAASGADALALYERGVSPEIAGLLEQRGLVPCARFQWRGSKVVGVYVPANRPCPAVPAP